MIVLFSLDMSDASVFFSQMAEKTFSCTTGPEFHRYLVDRAHSEPTATAYLAGPQPIYSKATGRGLFSLSM